MKLKAACPSDGKVGREPLSSADCTPSSGGVCVHVEGGVGDTTCKEGGIAPGRQSVQPNPRFRPPCLRGGLLTHESRIDTHMLHYDEAFVPLCGGSATASIIHELGWVCRLFMCCRMDTFCVRNDAHQPCAIHHTWRRHIVLLGVGVWPSAPRNAARGAPRLSSAASVILILAWSVSTTAHATAATRGGLVDVRRLAHVFRVVCKHRPCAWAHI